MAIKKYTSGAWVPTSYRKFGTETETITSLPAQIIGDRQAITSCQISGNTVQNGTPTPEASVDVVGCGARTRNLFDGRLRQGYYQYSNGALNPSEEYVPKYVCTYMIPCSGNTSYTFRCFNGEYGSRSYGFLFYNQSMNHINSNYTEYQSIDHVISYTATSPQNARYLAINVSYGNGQSQFIRPEDVTEFMLNAGSTPLPYEPFGYKLPPTVNGTEYPIYLGQVQTTRRIRKLVLTGDEAITSGHLDYNLFNILVDDYLREPIISLICTHYIAQSNVTEWNRVFGRNICFYVGPYIGAGILYIRNPPYTTVDDFKAYLAAQYAAGTPVTIWYVLAEPETGIVNEPLMKIGNYADTVTAANIPTTGIPETFDVQTTLKPSEVSLTYHGWHEHADTKYTQGE